MSKFKVGDAVRRLSGGTEDVVGNVSVVREWDSCRNMYLVGRRDGVMPEYYELVQAAPTEAKYLTPQETLENLLTDVPTQAMHCGEWLDIKKLDNVSVNFLRSMKCRTKPETVRVGEYEVVKPHNTVPSPTDKTYFYIRSGLSSVFEERAGVMHTQALFWETREDAYAALQAIKKTLLGETK